MQRQILPHEFTAPPGVGRATQGQDECRRTSVPTYLLELLDGSLVDTTALVDQVAC